MQRKPMQDIVPKNGRSIRNVPVPESRPPRRAPVASKPEPKEEPRIERRPEPVREERSEIEAVRREFESERPGGGRGGRSWKALGKAGAFAGVILLAALVLNFFHSATVAVTPRSASAAVSGDYVAKKVPGALDLGFQVITVNLTGTETVPATGEQMVNKKATGTIIVYNDYSSAPQRLIKNTRFQTPEGLIFRISDSVTVPGKKGTTPGSVEAVVVADEPGDKYNVGLKDFTIPGFKGDPRYSAFYARSKTPLAGGFSGIEKIVDPADRAKAKNTIEARLAADLFKEAEGKIPPDKIFWSKAYSIEYGPLAEEALSGDKVVIREDGTFSAVVFDRGLLSAALAKKHVPAYKGEPIMVRNLESLTFVPKGDFRPAAADSIAFSLAGTASFEWLYDELALKTALSDKPRSEIPALLQKFPTIEKADISVRPFWRRSFPDFLGSITIERAE